MYKWISIALHLEVQLYSGNDLLKSYSSVLSTRLVRLVQILVLALVQEAPCFLFWLVSLDSLQYRIQKSIEVDHLSYYFI